MYIDTEEINEQGLGIVLSEWDMGGARESYAAMGCFGYAG